MGPETLVAIACLVGNNESCNTSARAYYTGSPLPQYIETLRRENRDVAYGVTVLTGIYEKKATFSVGYNLETSINFNEGTGVPYLRWRIEY